MELLIFLVGRREQMVSREDIVKKLWHSDLFIDTDRNVNNIVRKVRTALGDNSVKQRFIETIVGKGYRFVGPVRVTTPNTLLLTPDMILRAPSNGRMRLTGASAHPLRYCHC